MLSMTAHRDKAMKKADGSTKAKMPRNLADARLEPILVEAEQEAGMAEEPEDLTLRMLREMREVLKEVRDKVYEHDERFLDLKKQIEDWQETTATGVGLAAPANLRTQAVEQQIADLARRVERLERTQ